MTVKRTNTDMAKDAACIAGEALVAPGVSLVAKGEVKSGLLHAGLGVAAKVALGPLGVLAVAANSYCKARTGESLYQKFTTDKGPGDFSVREEVTSAVAQGATVEEITEGITEDVEDIYHEVTLQNATMQDETATSDAEETEKGATA